MNAISPMHPGWEDAAARGRQAARLSRPSHVDVALVDQLGGDHLPKFCAAIGSGAALGFTRLPDWWGGEGVQLDARRLHALPRGHRHTLLLRASPDAMHILAIHVPSGDWREPALDLAGQGYASLAAHRWNTSETKAAWKLARLFGWRQPWLP